jgi:DNA-binding cell septation regulator SpoVG
MKVTALTCFPIVTQKQTKLKAKGQVTLENALELKYLVVEGSKGPFVTWQGTEQYTKKDGTTGYSSPIFITDKALNKSVQDAVIAKYTGGAEATGVPAENSAPAVDGNFTSDDIPF